MLEAFVTGNRKSWNSIKKPSVFIVKFHCEQETKKMAKYSEIIPRAFPFNCFCLHYLWSSRGQDLSDKVEWKLSTKTKQ